MKCGVVSPEGEAPTTAWRVRDGGDVPQYGDISRTKKEMTERLGDINQKMDVSFPQTKKGSQSMQM